MTPLTEVVHHPMVKEKFGLLMEAAELVASPQIRNQGTLGGNVSQDTRCWYYRGGWTCYRAGGNICYADTPTAMNREHAIFDADRCVAVNPSDTAPALIALDAQMVIRGRRASASSTPRSTSIGPGIDITRMNVLRAGRAADRDSHPGDDGPARSSTSRRCATARCGTSRSSTSRRRSRPTAATSARCAWWSNAVAATPRRLTKVEAAIVGKPRNEDTADMAGEMAVQGAQTLRHNGYKVPLMRNLVKRAIRGGRATWTS